MIILRLAAIVAACLTIILNATHGFKSTPLFHFAILFAVLNATLDVAKCSCLVGMGRAWSQRRPLTAGLLFLLFWPLLANSLWCGLSEVAIIRAEGTDDADRRNANATRLQAEQQRLSHELQVMQTNPMFEETAACALPKKKSAKAFCTTVAETRQILRELDGKLSETTIKDAHPHLTWVAEWTGWKLPNVEVGLALWPVLLAELVGSLGFYLTRKMPVQDSQMRSGWLWRLRPNQVALKSENAPTALLERSDAKPKPDSDAGTIKTPKLTWPSLPAA